MFGLLIRRQGFEEPDLTGFDTSDEASSPSPDRPLLPSLPEADVSEGLVTPTPHRQLFTRSLGSIFSAEEAAVAAVVAVDDDDDEASSLVESPFQDLDTANGGAVTKRVSGVIDADAVALSEGFGSGAERDAAGGTREATATETSPSPAVPPSETSPVDNAALPSSDVSSGDASGLMAEGREKMSLVGSDLVLEASGGEGAKGSRAAASGVREAGEGGGEGGMEGPCASGVAEEGEVDGGVDDRGATMTPTGKSLAGSSTNSDVSDWDRSLGSPSPGFEPGGSGGGGGGGGGSGGDHAPLVCRVSTAALKGAQYLEGSGEEDVVVCVQPGSAAGGGGGSGVAWSAAGVDVAALGVRGSRKSSSGPVLFRPAALTEEAMTSMGWGGTAASTAGSGSLADPPGAVVIVTKPGSAEGPSWEDATSSDTTFAGKAVGGVDLPVSGVAAVAAGSRDSRSESTALEGGGVCAAGLGLGAGAGLAAPVVVVDVPAVSSSVTVALVSAGGGGAASRVGEAGRKVQAMVSRRIFRGPMGEVRCARACVCVYVPRF